MMICKYYLEQDIKKEWITKDNIEMKLEYTIGKCRKKNYADVGCMGNPQICEKRNRDFELININDKKTINKKRRAYNKNINKKKIKTLNLRGVVYTWY